MNIKEHLPDNISASLQVIGLIVLGFALIPDDIARYFSVIPRQLFSLLGVVVMPFVHLSTQHLASNVIPLAVMMGLLSLLDKTPIVTAIKISLLGSALLWVFGRSDAAHMGASVLLFGLAAYLVVTGLKLHRKRNLAACVVVILLYGAGLAEGLVPKDGVSWDGHLAGVVAGIYWAMQWSGRIKKSPT